MKKIVLNKKDADEILRNLSSISTFSQVLVRLMLNYGLRLKEISNIKLNCLFNYNSHWYLKVPERNKGRKNDFYLCMNPVVLPLDEQVLEGMFWLFELDEAPFYSNRLIQNKLSTEIKEYLTSQNIFLDRVAIRFREFWASQRLKQFDSKIAGGIYVNKI